MFSVVSGQCFRHHLNCVVDWFSSILSRAEAVFHFILDLSWPGRVWKENERERERERERAGRGGGRARDARASVTQRQKKMTENTNKHRICMLHSTNELASNLVNLLSVNFILSKDSVSANRMQCTD